MKQLKRISLKEQELLSTEEMKFVRGGDDVSTGCENKSKDACSGNAFWLMLFLLFTSCHNIIIKDEINIEKAMENISESPFLVNDYFSDIEYIALETNDSSLIGIAPHVIVAKDIIVVSSLNQPLKIFDRKTGRFISNVGSIGQGPKEYAKGGFNEVNFWIDSDSQLIYVQGWNNDFLVYDKMGKYVDKVEIENEDSYNLHNCYFLMDDNQIWGHTKLHAKTEVPSVFCINKKDNQSQDIHTWISDVFSLENENLSINTRLGTYVGYGGHLITLRDGEDKAHFYATGSPSLWKYDGEVRLKQAFNDTIYTVTEDGLKPHEILGLGKWRWKEEDVFRTDGCNDRISIDYILENDDYFYFHLRTGLYDMKNTKVFCAFYDKRKKKTTLMKGAILEDRENNQEFSIRGSTSDGGFCAMIQPDKLSEKNLNRLNINEEDNPIVVILH